MTILYTKQATFKPLKISQIFKPLCLILF